MRKTLRKEILPINNDIFGLNNKLLGNSLLLLKFLLNR